MAPRPHARRLACVCHAGCLAAADVAPPHVRRRSSRHGETSSRPHRGTDERAPMTTASMTGPTPRAPLTPSKRPSTARRRSRQPRSALLALALFACSGAQSALAPGGREAEQLAELFWWMAGGAMVVWLVVMGLALYAAWAPPRPEQRGPRRLIIWGGVIVPSVT